MTDVRVRQKYHQKSSQAKELSFLLRPDELVHMGRMQDFSSYLGPVPPHERLKDCFVNTEITLQCDCIHDWAKHFIGR